ncbi:Solute carrier 26 [Datura stramonium]|uniref:Solute carrier 26 n=1 Tax=Datura stramonium TaxID=4076 RepID=A0ABS8WPS0_DATST|nr:Solute carrier 26 [Datura stramonium]
MSRRVIDNPGEMETDISRVASSRRHSENGLPYVHKVGVPPKSNLLKEIAETATSLAALPSALFITYLPLGERHNFSSFFTTDSSFVPPLVYAFMGSSRDIAIGPVAVVSLLLGSMLQQELDPVKQKLEYQRLAFTATFFAGITQILLGFFRLGFLIDFLSHAAIVGFMGGAAITISLQQLKGLLGIKKFTKKTDIISVMRSVFAAVHHGWNWQTIVIGVSFLAFLLVAKYIGKKNKKYFWVPAIAPLISVVLSTFFVFIFHAEKHDVQIVRHIDRGINPPSVREIYFSGEYLTKGFRIGAIQNSSNCWFDSTNAMKDYQLDGNREMVALGTMNIVGSMTSCYVATGRQFFNFKMMMYYRLLYHLPKLQVTCPRIAVLGKVPRTTVYRNIQQYPRATVSCILIVRVDSAIYFSNSNYMRDRILRWLTDEEEILKETNQQKIQDLIVEMSLWKRSRAGAGFDRQDDEYNSSHTFPRLLDLMLKIARNRSLEVLGDRLCICDNNNAETHDEIN